MKARPSLMHHLCPTLRPIPSLFLIYHSNAGTSWFLRDKLLKLQPHKDLLTVLLAERGEIWFRGVPPARHLITSPKPTWTSGSGWQNMLCGHGGEFASRRKFFLVDFVCQIFNVYPLHIHQILDIGITLRWRLKYQTDLSYLFIYPSVIMSNSQPALRYS